MSSLTYFVRRLAPFFWLFLAVETLMRCVLLVREAGKIAFSVPVALKLFAIGWVFDAAVFLYFAAFFGLYLLALPRRRHGSKVDRRASHVWRAVFAFTLLFTCVSEWFFWNEFAARFNFIAVDYLVYTHEVIANIRESYPVFPLIGGMAIIAVLIAYALRPRRPVVAPPLGKRGFAFLCAVLMAAAGYGALKSEYSEISDNRYTNEIAKNGFYELFAAFWHNELRYDRFYTTGEPKELEALLARHLGGDPSQPRAVRPGGEEKHYNLVLVTVESLSASFMKEFGNKDNITPNLDALADHSLFFTNLYATGTRTVYGLSSLSLGIPPLPGNSIVRRPQNDHLFTLGSLLNTKGYTSSFIYGGYGYFDNMNAFFAGNGYRIVDRSSLEKDESTFANAWGVSDEDLFLRVLREGDRAYAAGKPFFHMVMTTSNHRPFTYPDGRIDIRSHSGRGGAVKYTDYALGKLLQDAKAKPWFKDTIFVIIADHTAGSAGKAELDPEGYHIPLFIYAPGIIQPRRIDTLTSQIDVLPTLLGLMNMQYDSKFWGADALRNPPHRAFISNYQQLGYLTDEHLVVLKPVKRVDFYRKEASGFVPDAAPKPALLNDALSYYQNATHWREWNSDSAAE